MRIFSATWREFHKWTRIPFQFQLWPGIDIWIRGVITLFLSLSLSLGSVLFFWTFHLFSVLSLSSFGTFSLDILSFYVLSLSSFGIFPLKILSLLPVYLSLSLGCLLCERRSDAGPIRILLFSSLKNVQVYLISKGPQKHFVCLHCLYRQTKYSKIWSELTPLLSVEDPAHLYMRSGSDQIIRNYRV